MDKSERLFKGRTSTFC